MKAQGKLYIKIHIIQHYYDFIVHCFEFLGTFQNTLLLMNLSSVMVLIHNIYTTLVNIHFDPL